MQPQPQVQPVNRGRPPRAGRTPDNEALDHDEAMGQIHELAAQGGLAPSSLRQYTKRFTAFSKFVEDLVLNQPGTFQNSDVDLYDDELPAKIQRFLHQKLTIDSITWTSAEGVHSALKHYYGHVLRRGYQPYMYQDPGWIGNPAFHSEVVSYMAAQKRNNRNYIPNSSLYVTYDDMGQITTWCNEAPAAERVTRTQFNAMTSLSYYCWLRYDELKHLKVADLEFKISELQDVRYEFAKLTLTFRKTNQTNYEQRAEFEIHDRPTQEPNIMAYRKLKQWILYYRTAVGGDLQPDDFLFPQINNEQAGFYGVRRESPIDDQRFSGLLSRVVRERNLIRGI